MLVTESGKTESVIAKMAGVSRSTLQRLKKREDFQLEIDKAIRDVKVSLRAKCYRKLNRLIDTGGLAEVKEGFNRSEGRVPQPIQLGGKVDGDLRLHDGRIVEEMDDDEIRNAIGSLIRDLDKYARRGSTQRRARKKRSKKKS